MEGEGGRWAEAEGFDFLSTCVSIILMGTEINAVAKVDRGNPKFIMAGVDLVRTNQDHGKGSFGSGHPVMGS